MKIFNLLCLFYFYCNILFIHLTVYYIGSGVVGEGHPWTIECLDLKPGEKINWTRNGQALEELASGDITVNKLKEKGSKLVADRATELHEGDYKCTPTSNGSFHLAIKSGT